MLRRKAIDSLSVWKEKESKKPLIVEGARQVGKTFAIRAFSKSTYQSVYELNFLEKAGLRQIFEGDLNTETVLTGIRLSFPEVRFEAGHTLIFLDEIQACPQAVTALKFLGSDSRFDVIASCSALGMLHGRFPHGLSARWNTCICTPWTLRSFCGRQGSTGRLLIPSGHIGMVKGRSRRQSIGQ